MIKVVQLTYMINEATNVTSPYREIDTWINPLLINAIEDIRSFGSQWNKGTDYVVHFNSGLEIECVGEPQDLIDQINRTLVPYSLN
jgi:hypothetical protein